jgi:catechol 2,3-dioxygenase-like lactoylglutathione lyase family enzyme
MFAAGSKRPMKEFIHDRPSLYCIELRTENWPASVEWYRQVLGLRVLVRVVDDGYALLEAGDTRLALLARESSGEPSARISFAFEVHDMVPLLERLDGSEVVIKEAIDHPESLREVNLTDPDGNRIRIFCWPTR